MRRIGRDLRNLRDQVADTKPAEPARARMADGDHAMLSGKPLMGYRCLACDRPLEKLDEKPGPYLPTHQVKAAW